MPKILREDFSLNTPFLERMRAQGVRVVPQWRSAAGSGLGRGSRLALVFFVVFGLYQAWLLPVLTDWVSSAVDEGYTSYAAKRILQGEWPHRDFFFLWTPGTAVLHAALQLAGFSWLGERAAALLASMGSCALVGLWARDWKVSPLAFGFLLAGWSFSLWNIPYSSWYAVLLALSAVRVLPRSAVASGLLFALSFWFKQNIGILSCAGSVAWLLWLGERRTAARMLAAVSAGMLVPFAGMAVFGGWAALTQAFSQIFLFPLRYPQLMGQGLRGELLAAPLTSLGLWMLSLFFLRVGAESRSARMVQLGVLAYIVIYLFRSPSDFLLGGFFLLSIAAWPLSLAMAVTEPAESRARVLGLWLPGLGIFLQVYPRLDFQHFLFVFPLAALALCWSFTRMTTRYPRVPRFWAALPLVLLVVGGLASQKEVVDLRLNGSVDSLGRVSSGSGQRLNEEVIAVWRFLRSQGMKSGDPLLVLPNATALYLWMDFRNPTPHQQFFPGYVEAFGARQNAVLPKFREAGGRFLVVQERSGLEADVPEIAAEIARDWVVVKSFPENFTIYGRKP